MALLLLAQLVLDVADALKQRRFGETEGFRIDISLVLILLEHGVAVRKASDLLQEELLCGGRNSATRADGFEVLQRRS